MHDFSPLGDAKPSMAAFNLPPGLKSRPKTAFREVGPAVVPLALASWRWEASGGDPPTTRIRSPPIAARFARPNFQGNLAVYNSNPPRKLVPDWYPTRREGQGKAGKRRERGSTPSGEISRLREDQRLTVTLFTRPTIL